MSHDCHVIAASSTYLKICASILCCRRTTGLDTYHASHLPDVTTTSVDDDVIAKEEENQKQTTNP